MSLSQLYEVDEPRACLESVAIWYFTVVLI